MFINSRLGLYVYLLSLLIFKLSFLFYYAGNGNTGSLHYQGRPSHGKTKPDCSYKSFTTSNSRNIMDRTVCTR